MVLSVDKRAKILIEYLKNDHPNICQIARDVGCDRKSVKNIVDQWNKQKTIVHRTSPGRNRKVDEAQMNLFYAYVATPEGKTKSLKQLRSIFPHINYSIPDVSRLLCKKGMRCYVKKKKPHLEPRHIANRLNFAIKNQQQDWDKVVFSDEKIVHARFTGRQMIRRQRGEDDLSQIVPTKANNVKVNMWGCITSNFWYLFLLPKKTTDGAIYYNLLKLTFLPAIREKYSDFVFMQDGASIHNQAKQLLIDENVPTLDWPARSPDLNPIENVWGLMQKLVNKWIVEKKAPTNRTQLFSLCKKAFNTVCKKHLKALFESVPKRIEKTIEANGGHTKY